MARHFGGENRKCNSGTSPNPVNDDTKNIMLARTSHNKDVVADMNMDITRSE